MLEDGDTIIDGGNSDYRDDLRHAAALAQRGLSFVDCGTSGGVFGLERGYCLMIGGPDDVVARLAPIWDSLAPGVEAAGRTPGRAGEPAPEERGWLHCGPNGAGHFVKMVHNGIEYALMAAYAEGLNILRHADAGSVARGADAETAPLAHPEHYSYDLPLDRIAEVWRRGSVIGSWLLDLTAHALSQSPDLEEFAGRVSDSGRGPVDAAGRHRHVDPRPGAGRSAVRPVLLPRRGPVQPPGAVGHAQGVRRASGEAPGLAPRGQPSDWRHSRATERLVVRRAEDLDAQHPVPQAAAGPDHAGRGPRGGVRLRHADAHQRAEQHLPGHLRGQRPGRPGLPRRPRSTSTSPRTPATALPCCWTNRSSTRCAAFPG